MDLYIYSDESADFPNLKDVKLQYCNSAKFPLIRASDIIANRLFYLATHNQDATTQSNFYIKQFP